MIAGIARSRKVAGRLGSWGRGLPIDPQQRNVRASQKLQTRAGA
jgi:hypothetical protein